ncbi:hypothetical protein COX85_02005 [Candidatus Micrarchaeota archaeon CG_4_10_14_0_2_um_filter_55_9]|nr:MAG: hypothetical protein AUJ14_04775 [Candidatus Micrarchaeota archaeon CG1_02_55_22]PIZ91786.1 MAG: hypothetical protein COX85_02005 [Candidatus Micrarchaeota archaeon CG_4_10_14_0_2_um_filter_55_9]PJD00830.1 MAG: hypothetical protein COU38_04220 [Candidatus Micrarchaeota archaeon CG10_big_fil_rev_8_21_14_0_10_54_18]
MSVYEKVKGKVKEELYNRRLLYEKDHSEFMVKVGSVLEDFGLINVVNDDVTFDKAMFQTSFILPDPVINLMVVGCALYAAVAGGFI